MKNLSCAFMAMALYASSAIAQQPAYNQNSARSGNHSPAAFSDGWTFGLGTGASFPLNNAEKSLFRGNSIATKFSGNYHLGAIGLGFTGGWLPGTISQTGISQFLTERKIQQGQAQITTSNPFNSYFLLGPSFQLGNKVSFMGQLQGGFFLNNPGGVSILPNGATRPIYRFDAGTKNISPGLSGSLQLGYPINKTTRFLINTDYLLSSATVRLLDPGIGIDIPSEQKRKLQLFTAGIGIVKVFSSRDVASGQATGKRTREIKSPRDIASGMPTGKRILPAATERETASPRDIASGQATGRKNTITIDESGVHRTNNCCGPVTDRSVYEDGSIEEITFSCPEDAAVFFHEIKSPRDIATGQASGKRTNITIDESEVHRMLQNCGPVIDRITYPDGLMEERTFSCPADAAAYYHEVKSPRDIATGQASGRRNNITIDESGVHRILESCGPVTQRITYPDGSTSEQRFSCPNDALTYNLINEAGKNNMPNRISMNVTVPKQTQGATFGEKVNAGLHAAGSAISQRQTQGTTFGEKVNAGLHAGGSAIAQGASMTIISGNLSWEGANSGTGIVTNNTVSAVSSMAGGSGNGAAAASYAATGRMASGNTDNPKGMVADIFVRETGSGISSGKSGRDIASGQATGKRQYEPVFFEGNGDGKICNGCMASVSSNPLYTGNDKGGTNPLNQKNKDAVSGIDVSLIDVATNTVLAKTTPSPMGDFWFANVPEGEYVVKVTGSVTIRKQYDITLSSSGAKDVAGKMLAAGDQWVLKINKGNAANSSRMINTSRSNIKHIVVINADTDGDGAFDQFNVIGTFGDGSSADITSKCTINTSRSNIKQITIPFDAGSNTIPGPNKTVNTSRSNIKHISIEVGDGKGNNSFTATSTLGDGSSKDISNSTLIQQHPGVIQFQIDTDDSDGDGLADLIWSPRSNLTENTTARKGWDGTVKGLSAVLADVDGDGSPEIAVGNSTLSGKRASLLGGALPGGAIISAMVAGNPIGGISIKGGKNPGGNMRTTTTNEFGEFEFTGWEVGTYSITTEQKLIIDDETFVVAIDTDDQETTSRKGWDGTVKGGKQTPNTSFGEKTNAGQSNDVATPDTRAQNNNTVRSNRSDQFLMDADLDGDGSFETSLLVFNSEVGEFSIGEPGMPKDKKKATTGLKDTIKTQVRKSQTGNTGNAIPIKWMAPEVLRKTTHVSGDPHENTSDGRMIFGDNENEAIPKSNWRSKDVSVRPVLCADGTCHIITAKPEDFSGTSRRKLADIKATPIQFAEVLLVSEDGTVTRRRTDENGRISLNGLPPGVPVRMLLNVTVSGEEDIIVTFQTDAQGSSISNVLKTKHDTAKNSVGNIR